MPRNPCRHLDYSPGTSTDCAIDTVPMDDVHGNPARLMYYILSGHEPVLEPDFLTWARWLETADRIVQQTHLGDVLISTVFLGLDHSFGYGAPVLFETMIFDGEHDSYQDRYVTWAEAEAGHRRAVLLAGGPAQGAG